MTRRLPSPAAPELIVPPPPLPIDANYANRVQSLAALHDAIRVCQQCVVAGYLARANTVGATRGRIGDQVMVVGQAPGHLSVERGMPFAGPGGAILDRWLQQAGFAAGALHREVYLSALTRCDPGKNPRGTGDRKPSPPELALCRPYLLRELELLRPQVILPVGGMAIAAFLGSQRLEDVIGEAFERNGVLLIPLPHPSGVSRWLNDASHQQLLARALAHLSAWRDTAYDRQL
jgi:uracil-DNA glycosylase family 4